MYCLVNLVNRMTQNQEKHLLLLTEEPTASTFFSREQNSDSKDKNPRLQKGPPFTPHTHCNSISEHLLSVNDILGTLCITHVLHHLFYPQIMTHIFHNYL